MPRAPSRDTKGFGREVLGESPRPVAVRDFESQRLVGGLALAINRRSQSMPYSSISMFMTSTPDLVDCRKVLGGLISGGMGFVFGAASKK